MLYVLSTITTLAGFSDLRVALALFAVLAALSVALRRIQLPARSSVWLFAGAAALLFLSILTQPVYWDSYAHWLPNSAYLFQLDHFPRSPLQDFPSLHPSYPPALPLLIYGGSRLTHHFAELGANVLNVLLSWLVMGCVVHLMRRSSVLAGAQEGATPLFRCGLPLLAACIVIPLNPAIELQHYWSVIADPALGVVIFIAIVTWCQFMADEREEGSVWTVSASLFALGVLTGGLKPSGWLLGLILAGAGIFVAMVQRVPAKKWLAPAIALAAGGLLALVLWKSYLAAHLPIPDQFSIQPLRAWRFDLAKELFRSMLLDFRAHWIYGLYVVATMTVGFLALVRRSIISNPTLRLMLCVSSVAMLLHVASLIAAYLGTGFEALEIRQAACFQRYSSQVGYSLCVAGLVTLSLKVLAIKPRRFIGLTMHEVAVYGTAACLALFAVLTVRPTLVLALKARQDAHLRMLALEALKSLPPGARVAVMGDRWALNFLRYESWVGLKAAERPRFVDRHQILRAETDQSVRILLTRWTADPDVDAILLVDAGELAIRSGLGVAPDQVWRRQDRQWRAINSRRHS
jgi:hypothetical protein